MNMNIENITQAIEKVGATVSDTAEKIGAVSDRNHEKRVKRWEGFNLANIEKTVKRLMIVAGIAAGLAALIPSISGMLFMMRVCKTVEVVARLALGQP